MSESDIEYTRLQRTDYLQRKRLQQFNDYQSSGSDQRILTLLQRSLRNALESPTSMKLLVELFRAVAAAKEDQWYHLAPGVACGYVHSRHAVELLLFLEDSPCQYIFPEAIHDISLVASAALARAAHRAHTGQLEPPEAVYRASFMLHVATDWSRSQSASVDQVLQRLDKQGTLIHQSLFDALQQAANDQACDTWDFTDAFREALNADTSEKPQGITVVTAPATQALFAKSTAARAGELSKAYGLEQRVDFWERPVPEYKSFTSKQLVQFEADASIRVWSQQNSGRLPTYVATLIQPAKGTGASAGAPASAPMTAASVAAAAAGVSAGEPTLFSGVSLLNQLLDMYAVAVGHLAAERKSIQASKRAGKLLSVGSAQSSNPHPFFLQEYTDVPNSKVPIAQDIATAEKASALYRYYTWYKKNFGTPEEILSPFYLDTTDTRPFEKEDPSDLPLAKRIYNLDGSIAFGKAPSDAQRVFTELAQERVRKFQEHIRALRLSIHADNWHYLEDRYGNHIRAASRNYEQQVRIQKQEAYKQYEREIQYAKHQRDELERKIEQQELSRMLREQEVYRGKPGESKGMFGEVGNKHGVTETDVHEVLSQLNMEEKARAEHFRILMAENPREIAAGAAEKR